VCRLSSEEARFIAATLETLIHLLQSARPEQDDILQLRSDLGLCMGAVVHHCGDIPRKALDVENLGQPPWREHFRIEEIVPDPGRLAQ
jgi:hypothetical protein